MSASFRHRMAVWLWNALNAALSGVVGVFTTVVGTETVNAISPNTVAHFTPHQLLVTFIVGAGIGVANFVRQNGLPSLDTSDGTISIPPPKA